VIRHGNTLSKTVADASLTPSQAKNSARHRSFASGSLLQILEIDDV
jgi:hypothetical protein